MKYFEEPVVDVVKIAVEDIITTSPDNGNDDPGFFTSPCI